LARGSEIKTSLALASCGNAALAAATLASAVHRDLAVFIPPSIDPVVHDRLQSLHANIHICEREPDAPAGDPCYQAFCAAVEEGAVPFCCQGSDNGLTIDGGQTLVWEMASQLRDKKETLDRLFVQAGGGALSSACYRGLVAAHATGQLAQASLPRLHVVQTEGCFPLNRAYSRVLVKVAEEAGFDEEWLSRRSADEAALTLAGSQFSSAIDKVLREASKSRSSFMWAWEEEPHSIAHGILDDETYDWLAVVEGMLRTGGYPVLVNDPGVVEAYNLGHSMGKSVCHTGASGLAGLLQLRDSQRITDGEHLAVIFSGSDREQAPQVEGLGNIMVQWENARDEQSEIQFRKLGPDFDADTLVQFNANKGMSDTNWIPQEYVSRHLQDMAGGTTQVWGAYEQDRMVGFISYSLLYPRNWWSEYWEQVKAANESAGRDVQAAFIHELVVDPEYRGRSIGTDLCRAAQNGVFSLTAAQELYTSINAQEAAGKKAFQRAGFSEVVTYQDQMRDRKTTILKATRPEAVLL